MQKSELKIALVSLQKDAEKEPPIGLVYLATYLRDRTGLSEKNIKIFDRNFFNVEEELKKFKPHILGISSMTINYQDSIEFAKKIKYERNIPIILGGVHISTLPESFKNCFDVGVIGEGELTLNELIELYLKKEKFLPDDLKKIKSVVYYNKSNIKKTLLRELLELDSLPIPDFGFIHQNYFKKKEVSGIGTTAVNCYLLSSRGCPYRCKFCSTSRFWGKMRLHSPEYVAKIVEDQIKKYNADYIHVLDDLFTISSERLIQIKKELEKKDIFKKIKYIGCTVRANLVNDELCRAMRDIKVKCVNFGFESGSERMLNYLKVGSVTLSMNKKSVVMCRKYGFNIYGSLMYGSPTETIEDMKQTNKFIDFCIKNGASYIWSFVTIPFPATPFWDIALERGKVSDSMDFSKLNLHGIDNPLLLDDNINKEEFKKVFLEGRDKLKKLKFKLIKNFVVHNFTETISMFFKEPKYYINRVYTKIFKN